ncbi:ArsR/SmtB family transcription factor [Tabrizicola piscis]|uniref:ArsR/SmtB family transcription factor n=1 Tax=Tabrizicola piscis TaxID=2494374 RepID=UPI001FE35291|nr:metalloregulator ArsR/SmtB family transcription factor [Tabrizicola piscis]
MERSKVDRTQALSALSALANETRLDLIRMLMPAGDAGMPAGQIAQALGLTAPRLSFHLAAMEQAGLLRSRKLARNVIYSVDATGIGRTISYLLNDCCHDHPEVLAACAHGSATRACHHGAVDVPATGTENT